MQVYDAVSTGLHWQIQKGGGFHYHEAERMDQPLPVTVSLGGPPALILAAIAPLPEDVPELVLASLLTGETEDDSQPGRPGKAPACCRSGICARRACATTSKKTGRTVRRSLRLLLAASRLSGLQRGSHLPPARRDLSGNCCRQAAAGRLFHRRLFAEAAVAGVSAGDAFGARSVDVWRDGLSLALRRGGARALSVARRWFPASGFSVRASCR